MSLGVRTIIPVHHHENYQAELPGDIRTAKVGLAAVR